MPARDDLREHVERARIQIGERLDASEDVADLGRARGVDHGASIAGRGTSTVTMRARFIGPHELAAKLSNNIQFLA